MNLFYMGKPTLRRTSLFRVSDRMHDI